MSSPPPPAFALGGIRGMASASPERSGAAAAGAAGGASGGGEAFGVREDGAPLLARELATAAEEVKEQSLMQTITELKAKQKAQKNERQAIQKQFKNAQQRKRRLKARARQLSNEDLMAVMLMREEQASASASTSASSGASSALSSSAVPGERGVSPAATDM